MNEGTWVAVAAVTISAATFVYAALFKTSNGRTQSLEERCRSVEEQLRISRLEVQRLVEENIQLMRQLLLPK